VCSIEYQPFKHGKGEDKKTYRLVIMREDTGNSQINLFTEDTLAYRAILTSDRKSTEKEIILYYNQRGAEERTIDMMNNDFGWNRMPFSFLEENTVFLIVMMICRNIYSWLIEKYSGVMSDLKNNFRLKKFIFRFITVPTKWIRRGGQWVLKVYSDKPYDLVA
jgi:hypothetical protein